MQLRAEQLEAHLRRSLAPLYVIHGEEPLLALEAADMIRAAARKQGCTERALFIAERYFDWSELFYAGASMSLFGDKKIIELRLPTGKPGTEGAKAIERYCAGLNPDCLTLVSLPRLDKAAQNSAWFGALSAVGTVVDIRKIERPRLPEWIGQRLARGGQRCTRETLEFLADRVEGNLLAAHQEVQKLALLLPAGELTRKDVEAAVSNVARYDVQALAEALLLGDTARYARVLEGLRGEGEAPTFVLWAVAEELRALARILAGLSAGRQIEQLLRENRVWRNREAAMKAALRRFTRESTAAALSHAALIDRVIKGLLKGNAWDEFLKLGLTLQHGH
ncbi:MAG: DNA polymerase III subunit delta [Betaproteobacteria bacterium]|nr:DNA polymerase III subunit delta [Betaproteobacteria bacterium]